MNEKDPEDLTWPYVDEKEGVTICFKCCIQYNTTVTDERAGGPSTLCTRSNVSGVQGEAGICRGAHCLRTTEHRADKRQPTSSSEK